MDKKTKVYGGSKTTSSSRRITERSPLQGDVIEYKGMRFLITDTPHEVTIRPFIDNLIRYNVKILVGACGVNYSTAPFEDANIEVRQLHFEEGTLPDDRLRKSWFRMLLENKSNNPDSCVAIHCNSGLGRAALLVALALIELGMGYEEAVLAIRNKRRGAINRVQYDYLRQYRAEEKMGGQPRSVACGMQ